VEVWPALAFSAGGDGGRRSPEPLTAVLRFAFRVVFPMARPTTYRTAQRDRRLRDTLANAQIIQFAPYLARKREQEVQCLLARRIHHSPMVEGDIRAWVAAMIEWGARAAFLMRQPSNLSPSATLWLSLKNWGAYGQLCSPETRNRDLAAKMLSD
jgi:hypothetical protein